MTYKNEDERTAARLEKLRGMRTSELKQLRQELVFSQQDPTGIVRKEIRSIIIGRGILSPLTNG